MDLEEKVLAWAVTRDLLHEENAERQFLKMVEEVLEFKTELDRLEDLKKYQNSYEELKKDEVMKNLKLEMGDIIVTIIIECGQLGISPTSCLQMAYEKIRDRKGKTINGTFVKEEDL